MKVIFMGTPDFAVNTLEKIIEAGHEVMLVVTQPDKPKGRGNTMQFPPVKECAVSHGLETMYEANGVGLAAPQVGILKRMVVIDIGDGQGPFIMINPEIIESDGEQTGDEGCLSLPGKAGQVTRPNHVKAKFYDLDMNEWEVEGEGLMARCICHELDHLDGHMYTEKVEGGLHDVNYEEPEEE